MANEIDISERWLLKVCPKAFEKLLLDHTTGQNIYWASESYADRGEGFGFFDPITIEKIKNDDVIIPRVRKNTEEQSRRVKDKAEVFTPAWICNAQNNLVDDAWFGIPNVFNTPNEEDSGKTWTSKLNFPANFGKVHKSNPKSWVRYVNDPRLEITCGEAPYLMSRYDAVSGEEIAPDKRIGMFDRKMQVINAFVHEPPKWMERVTEALQATYGFEWQGDSLLLARESMLLTIFDYFFEKFPEERPTTDSKNLINGVIIKRQPFSRFINNCAYFISWNLWQMDGLKFVLPGTSNQIFKILSKEEPQTETTVSPVIVGIEDEEIKIEAITPAKVRTEAAKILNEIRDKGICPRPEGVPAVIADWNHKKGEDKEIFFASLLDKQVDTPTEKNNTSKL